MAQWLKKLVVGSWNGYNIMNSWSVLSYIWNAAPGLVSGMYRGGVFFLSGPEKFVDLL